MMKKFYNIIYSFVLIILLVINLTGCSKQAETKKSKVIFWHSFVATTIPTSVETENTVVDNYYLEQNYPNPFNPSTIINYGLKKSDNVEITVYNVLGNKVATLVNGYKSAGMHSVDFNAANLASGIYFYKIVTPGFIQTQKMILEK